MNFEEKRISYAASIITGYTGKMPFHLYLKQYFKQHKKFGSGDRKAIAEACYSYWRLGKSYPQADVVSRIRTGLFVCASNLFFGRETATLTLAERLQQTKETTAEFDATSIFCFQAGIHPTIANHHWQMSFLQQPDVFLRIRPEMHQRLLDALNAAGIRFTIEEHQNDCIRLAPSVKIDEVIHPDREAVIQDKNSQKVISLLAPFFNEIGSVWDCCAASGGKSIHLYDSIPNVEIHASDVRPSILHNLRKRFERAGVMRFTSAVTDVAKPNNFKRLFDLVVCDVPCTGSGTWSRTPEQLVFFDEATINDYQQKQRKIVSNASNSVKPGGLLLYITCSVFSAENEENVAYFSNTENLELITSELAAGYLDKADTLYAALFRKPI